MFWGCPLQCMEYCKGKGICRRYATHQTCRQKRGLDKHLPTLYRMLCPHRVHSTCQKERASKNRGSIGTLSRVLWLIDTIIEKKSFAKIEIFGKAWFWGIWRKCDKTEYCYFFANEEKEQKACDICEKWLILWPSNPVKSRAIFAKAPLMWIIANHLRIFDEENKSDYQIVIKNILLQISGFAIKNNRHLRKIGMRERK